MPTFRRQHVLNRTINSIQSQTFDEWELILVNNDHGEVLSLDDARIRVASLPLPRGAGHARNHGLGLARGDAVVFFDDDDLMFEDYLESVERELRDPRVMAVRCGMILRNGHVDYSLATPEVVVRREYLSPTWSNEEKHDQVYYARILKMNGWGQEEVKLISRPLCQAMHEPTGGLRDDEGKL